MKRFDVKLASCVAELHEKFVESTKLEKAIRENLKTLGYD